MVGVGAWTSIEDAVDLERLRRIAPISVDDRERRAHARDLWPRTTLALATRSELPPSPAVVVWPSDEDAVAACLEWAESEAVAVVPYGAGSGVCGAASGLAGSVALDLKRMNRVGGFEGTAVRVQPGVIGQHLEDALERVGRATRHSPSSIWCSTVGGWAASRSAGQFSSKYGKFEDMVRAMRVVAPTRRFGTGEWSSGEEDLGPWVLGTEGALGVITELLVETVPFPAHRRFAAWRFETVEAAWEAMRALMQSELHPAVIRLYDPVDTRLAGKGTATRAGEGARWLQQLRAAAESIPALRSHLFSLPLALPRLLNALLRGVASGCVLIVGWEGPVDVVEVLARHGQALVSTGTPLGHEPGEHWYAHRHEVSYKLAPVFERGGFADTMEVAATWSRLPALYEGVRAAIGRHAVVMAHFSHAYAEGCSIYFSFAGVGNADVYDAVWRDALAAAAAAGGTVAHHHGVGQLKQVAAARELSGIAPRFRALKAALDPRGILNPGRLFPELPLEPEPPTPALGIDPVSRIATLEAHAEPAARDAWLAGQGWRLRFPSARSLAHSVAGPRRPWEARVVGASVRIDGRRAVFVPVPRSAAGPDPRAAFPPAAYETVTVPVVPLDTATVAVRASAEACRSRDIRPLPSVDGSPRLAGPAAADLAALLGGES